MYSADGGFTLFPPGLFLPLLSSFDFGPELKKASEMRKWLLVLCFAVIALPGFSDQIARRRDYYSGGGARGESSPNKCPVLFNLPATRCNYQLAAGDLPDMMSTSEGEGVMEKQT